MLQSLGATEIIQTDGSNYVIKTLQSPNIHILL